MAMIKRKVMKRQSTNLSTEKEGDGGGLSGKVKDGKASEAPNERVKSSIF